MAGGFRQITPIPSYVAENQPPDQFGSKIGDCLSELDACLAIATRCFQLVEVDIGGPKHGEVNRLDLQEVVLVRQPHAGVEIFLRRPHMSALVKRIAEPA